MLGLSYIRKLYGYTLKDLGKKTDASPQLINKMERGNTPIKDDKLDKLAEIFNLDKKYFTKELSQKEMDEIKEKKNKQDIEKEKNKAEAEQLEIDSDLKKASTEEKINNIIASNEKVYIDTINDEIVKSLQKLLNYKYNTILKDTKEQFELEKKKNPLAIDLSANIATNEYAKNVNILIMMHRVLQISKSTDDIVNNIMQSLVMVVNHNDEINIEELEKEIDKEENKYKKVHLEYKVRLIKIIKDYSKEIEEMLEKLKVEEK